MIVISRVQSNKGSPWRVPRAVPWPCCGASLLGGQGLVAIALRVHLSVRRALPFDSKQHPFCAPQAKPACTHHYSHAGLASLTGSGLGARSTCQHFTQARQRSQRCPQNAGWRGEGPLDNQGEPGEPPCTESWRREVAAAREALVLASPGWVKYPAVPPAAWCRQLRASFGPALVRTKPMMRCAVQVILEVVQNDLAKAHFNSPPPGGASATGEVGAVLLGAALGAVLPGCCAGCCQGAIGCSTHSSPDMCTATEGPQQRKYTLAPFQHRAQHKLPTSSFRPHPGKS